MNKECEQDDFSNVVNYLLANLIEYFRDPKTEHQFVYAVTIASRFIFTFTNEDKSHHEKRFFYFARKLKGNLNPISLREFSCECLDYAKKAGFFYKQQSARQKTIQTLRKQARNELMQAMSFGHSQGAAIHRTAFKLFKEKKRSDRIEQTNRLIDAHPLSETFLALGFKNKNLAKEDIKNHLLRLKKAHPQEKNQGTLFQLLKKAQVFSTARLHKLLGDELFFLCRPLGFLDRQKTVVVIEVPTSNHLHALTYRKPEIIRALKQDAEFQTVKNLRFKLKDAG